MGQVQEKEKPGNINSLHLNTQLVYHYYLFQKKIQTYLKDWKNVKDLFDFEKGYILHPDWVNEYRDKIKYEKLKPDLDKFLLSKKFTYNQQMLLYNFTQPAVINFDLNSINCNSSFNLKEKFLSLEKLKSFINKDTYSVLNKLIDKRKKGIKIEEVKYILKQKMIILLNEFDKIIKIIYFYENENENENKITNLTFKFAHESKYNEYKNYFKKNDSEQIIKHFTNMKIFETKIYTFDDINSKANNFTISYEEDNNATNITNTTNMPNVVNTTNTQNTTNTPNTQNGPRKSVSENNNIKELLNDNGSNITKTEDEDKNNLKLNKEITINEKDLNDLIKNDKILSLTLIRGDNSIIMPLTCKSNSSFKNIEEQIYEEFPEYKKDELTFSANGASINRKSTLEENHIKNRDTIILYNSTKNNE